MTEHIYRLFSQPSFVEGMARLFDFGGKLNNYNYSETEDEADFNAIYSDWQTVGQDMLFAFEKFEAEKKGKN